MRVQANDPNAPKLTRLYALFAERAEIATARYELEEQLEELARRDLDLDRRVKALTLTGGR